MRCAILSGALLVAIVGCSRHDKKPPPTNGTATRKSAPPPISWLDSGSTGAVEPIVANADAGTPPPRSAAEIAKNEKPPIEASIEQPVFRTKTSKGKLVVWSTEDGKGSVILGGYESTPGELIGEAKVLRRTSGQVAALDVVSLGGGGSANGLDAGVATDAGGLDGGADVTEDLVVGWTSNLPDGKGQVAAVVFTGADLARVATPRTLGIVNAPVAQEGHIAMKRNPRGGVVVAHEGATGKCMLSDMPTECVTYEVKAVDLDGKVTKLGGGKLHGGPSPEFTLLDLDGRGLLVYASSMRGGRTLDAIAVPYVAGEATPPFDIPRCIGLAGIPPEILRGTRGERVAICLDSLDELCTRSARDAQKRCSRVAITGADGKAITPKDHDVSATRVECTAGKAKITFAGGDVTLAETSETLAEFPRCALPKRP